MRPVGRPRQYGDEEERELIFSGAYRALRDHGDKVTIARILEEAGVSTRSFYRHFESKDALLSAMYRRDAQWAANAIRLRLARAEGPAQAVDWWVDEIFKMTGDLRRAERVAVLGSIAAGLDAASTDSMEARNLLVDPLEQAIRQGIDHGEFHVVDAASAADLVSAVTMHAAGIRPSPSPVDHDRDEVARFCIAALRGLRD